MLIHILGTIIAGFGLYFASKLTLKYFFQITSKVALPQFIVSFLLLGIVTSSSELMIGINSALIGVPNLSFGDILGTNIINLTLVLGIAAIAHKGIKTETQGRSHLVAFLGILAPILLALDGSLSRIDGFILITTYLFIATRMIQLNHSNPLSIKNPPVPAVRSRLYIIKFIASFILY